MSLELVHDTGADAAAWRVVVLFTGDRVKSSSSKVARLSSFTGAAEAVQARLPGSRVLVLDQPQSISWARLADLLSQAGISPGTSLTLVAFSSGCMQLNALLREASLSKRDEGNQGSDDHVPRATHREAVEQRLRALRAVHYVDAGSGAPGTFWTDNLGALADMLSWRGVSLYLHATPRQHDDARRPWIREEALTVAAATGATLSRLLASETPSLEQHFRALELFSE